jgi:TyrR family helix-turn-helix protein
MLFEKEDEDEHESVPPRTSVSGKMSLTEQLDEAEKNILQKAVINCGSTRELAKLLRTSQSTIVRKMKKYGLLTHQ